MHKGQFVFAQLVQFMNRNHFNYHVRKYESDKYIKSYTYCNQLLTIMFGQFFNRESFQDLIVAMVAHAGKLYHLGVGKSVTRSNLSKTTERRASAELIRSLSLTVMSIRLIPPRLTSACWCLNGQSFANIKEASKCTRSTILNRKLLHL